MKRYDRIIFVCNSGTAQISVLKFPMEIESRGMVVLFPEPLNQKVEAVLISNGINVENQMSKQLSGEDLLPENLIITMEAAQKQKILEEHRDISGVDVEVLTDLTGDELEILNPYGGTLQSYGICYETLNKTIRKLVNLINEGEEAYGKSNNYGTSADSA